MVKILFIFGTRPEAIKMAPIIIEAKKSHEFKPIVCVTGQHDDLLIQMLNVFKIIPDYNLNIMQPNQTLFNVTSKILLGLENILKKEAPDIVLVQGDTTTAFIGALAAFYLKIKVGHIEAGLRSFDKFQPFPEEINRKCVDVFADLYFAPTKISKLNLINEGISKKNIFITGNTVVDALNRIIPLTDSIDLKKLYPFIDYNKKIILVTAHRRENFGVGIRNISLALEQISRTYKNIQIVFPVHPNPNISEQVYKIIKNKNIFLIKPLDYFTFLKILKICTLVLSDSGGVQEEAPYFKKPVLILREVTERPEVLHCGLGKLVGTDCNKIVLEVKRILDKKSLLKLKIRNPFGTGESSKKILKILKLKVK